MTDYSEVEGLVPWGGRAVQVRVGHRIQGRKATKADVWEVTDMRTPDQIQTNYTLWWKVVNVVTGEELAAPPRQVSERITFMVPEDELAKCESSNSPPWMPREWPSDAEQVKLLMESLGGALLAQHDSVTGEVTCPEYAAGLTVNGWETRKEEQWAHLRICHGVDTSGLEAMHWDEEITAFTKLHGELHGFKPIPSIGGFPHRHVPEDHSVL